MNPKCDLTGARTQDPLLKREMLCQLSYQVYYKNVRKNLGDSLILGTYGKCRSSLNDLH